MHRATAAQTSPALVVAYGASYLLGSVISYAMLRRRLGGLETPRLVRFLVRLLIAALIAAGITAVLRHLLPGGGDDVSHVLAALRVVVLGAVDVLRLRGPGRAMHVREVSTVRGHRPAPVGGAGTCLLTWGSEASGRGQVPEHNRPGDVLADRYRLTDLLTESKGGRFWRAFDTVLQRDVAVHIIACDDERAPLLRGAARTSATVLDRRMLRVLDIDEAAERCFVVNEWGSGTSLDILLADGGPLSPTVAAWIVAEVADTLGPGPRGRRGPRPAGPGERADRPRRLGPADRLRRRRRAARPAVRAHLHRRHRPRRPAVRRADRQVGGRRRSAVPSAPSSHGHVLRPRQVRAGIPRTLDSLCDHVLNHGGDIDVTAAMLSRLAARLPRRPRRRRPRPGWPGSSTPSAARVRSCSRRCPTRRSARRYAD